MTMGMERMSGDREGRDYVESRKSRRKQRKLSPVQMLYETCKEVFANCGPNIVPSPNEIGRLKGILDVITEVDVGLQRNMPYFRPQNREGYPTIAYQQLYECDKFSIGLFCLPPSGVLPLHNHPGMTVFSKLLFGTMRIKSFDWVDASPPKANEVLSAGVRLAKLKVDSDFTAPCNTSILYPEDGGNLHCFTARTPCAVLDVLGPPYCDAEGRHCAYYLDFPFADFPGDGISVTEEGDGYAWLKEREIPEGLLIVGVPYSGPKIVAK